MNVLRLAKKKIRISTLLFLICIIVTTGCGRATQSLQSSEPAESSQITEKNDNDTNLKITALKAGAADAFILRSGDDVVLIDTGLEKNVDRLLGELDKQGITKISCLIITHFDKDHVGGADHVIDDYEVEKVYTTYHSKDSDDIDSYLGSLQAKGLSETVVTKETSFDIGDISFTIYPPQATSYNEKISNNSSLVIRVTLGEKSILFAGDAEEERIAELLETQGLQSTILKIPHHGRLASNSQQLIDYIDPEYAIITSSGSNPEDQEILDILEQKEIKTYLTRNGNITLTITPDEVTIEQ